MISETLIGILKVLKICVKPSMEWVPHDFSYLTVGEVSANRNVHSRDPKTQISFKVQICICCLFFVITTFSLYYTQELKINKEPY